MYNMHYLICGIHIVSALNNHLNIYRLQTWGLIRKYIKHALLKVCFTESLYTLRSFKNIYRIYITNFFDILITVMEVC